MSPTFSISAASPCSSRRSGQIAYGEAGIAIPLLALFLFVLILMFGLALDGGNLYRARIRLQKAADAAALAAGAVLAIEGSGAVDKAMDAGQRIGAANLQLTGLTPSTFTVNYDAGARRVDVDLASDVDLYLMPAVPGMGSSRRVSVEAKAELSAAIVAAIVDTSGSMACRFDTNDCSCYPLCGSQKINRVKPALKKFLKSFDKTRDFISVTKFAQVAEVYPAMSAGSGGFNPSDIDWSINSIGTLYPVQGQANLCDAFQRAYLDTKDVLATLPEGTETHFVVLTDGYPTAARFAFANVRPTLPPHNNVAGNPWWAAWDYMNWKVEGLVGGAFLEGPQEMAKANGDYTLFEEGVPQHMKISTNCSAPGLGSPAAAFAGCIQDWAFRTEDRVWRSGNANFGEYEQRYYDCALAWADHSRSQYGIWYTVGFGAPCPPDALDPYQGVGSPGANNDCRHDTFLRRIAFSREGAADPPFPGFDSFSTLEANRYQHGESLSVVPGVDTGDELEKLFERISRRIKVRLIQ